MEPNWESVKDGLKRMDGIDFNDSRMLADMRHLYEQTFTPPVHKHKKQVRRLIQHHARRTLKAHRSELRGHPALEILVVMSKGRKFTRVYRER